MPVLSDAEFKMVAEIVTELARTRGAAFDKAAKGSEFARAALIDPAFKVRLAEAHRRLDVWHVMKASRTILAPIAPALHELEREAEIVLSGWKP